MKKWLITIGLVLALFNLTACSNVAPLQEEKNIEPSIAVNAKPAQDVSSTLVPTPEESAEVQRPAVSNAAMWQDISAIPQEQNDSPMPEKSVDNERDMLSNTYTIIHEKDNTSYTVETVRDSNYSYTINLFDTESNQLQFISLGWCPEGIDFEDVNLDGYVDIVANTGGTWNEMHDLYIWDVSSSNFIKVLYEGFDMLSFFEVHDGYINNFIRGSSPDDSVVERLIWKGNVLIKES